MGERDQRRWGKAGVRLTAQEARKRDREIIARRNRDRAAKEFDLAVAKQLWAAGALKPWLITDALDARGLYGPEVDIACGTREPNVDLWEAGKVYPTWQQVLLLANLTGVTPKFLCSDYEPLRVEQTSLRFHVPDYVEPPLVREFDPDAVVAVVGAQPKESDRG